jgi:hypothetical protein
VAREVREVIGRYPVAFLLPAAALGLGADALQLVERTVLSVVLVGLGLAVAFELYVGYAERVLLEAEAGVPRIRIARVLHGALPLIPPLLAASILAVAVPLAAAGALVIPGLWLATRWSLFAPAISKEGVGPLAALRRSNELVRGHTLPVFLTATVPLLVEHAVIHATALRAEPVVDSRAVGLVVAALAVTLVSPAAALTISVAYDRLAGAAGGGTGWREL